jgi:hypothetical protein
MHERDRESEQENGKITFHRKTFFLIFFFMFVYVGLFPHFSCFILPKEKHISNCKYAKVDIKYRARYALLVVLLFANPLVQYNPRVLFVFSNRLMKNKFKFIWFTFQTKRTEFVTHVFFSKENEFFNI